MKSDGAFAFAVFHVERHFIATEPFSFAKTKKKLVWPSLNNWPHRFYFCVCFEKLCLEKAAANRIVEVPMQTVRHLEKQAAPGHSSPVDIQVLNIHGYDQIRRKKRKTLEIHLTPALFPSGKITPGALRKVIAHKAPPSGPYNVVFHFSRSQEGELTGKLEKAWQKMPDGGSDWYILFTNANRAATEERVSKLVPRGMVKSSKIDAALAGQA